MKYLIIVSLVVFSLANMAMARDSAVGEPGYVSFENLEHEYGEARVSINLNSTMLTFMSKLSGDDETGELLGKLKAVKVHVYDIADNDEPALELISRTVEKISTDNWMPVVTVNEPDEKIRIFSKITGDVMDGLVVMAINDDFDGREAVFINIVGEIDPAQLGKVTDSLNIKIN